MPRLLGPSLPPVYTHRSAVDGLRHQRGRRHLDFAACDVGRCATNADRGHDASALMGLRFNFAWTPHRDTLLDRKVIGRPAKIMLRCHGANEGGTGAARRGTYILLQNELAWITKPYVLFHDKRTGCADRGMPRKVELRPRCEDAHPTRVRRIVLRQNEGRFAEIEFTSNLLHALGRNANRVWQNRQLITAERC